jgi:hypothetical protein
MPIGQIDYATIQRTTDVETYKHQEETKPVMDQQNIQVQVEQRADDLRHQVLDPQNSRRMENDSDAKEEGHGKYTQQKGHVREKKILHDQGRVIRKQRASFDMKI